jgi:hypothetical protein
MERDRVGVAQAPYLGACVLIASADRLALVGRAVSVEVWASSIATGAVIDCIANPVAVAICRVVAVTCVAAIRHSVPIDVDTIGRALAAVLAVANTVAVSIAANTRWAGIAAIRYAIAIAVCSVIEARARVVTLAHTVGIRVVGVVCRANVVTLTNTVRIGVVGIVHRTRVYVVTDTIGIPIDSRRALVTPVRDTIGIGVCSVIGARA